MKIVKQYAWILSVLTEKEKELERLAIEKEWEEIDKETNK